MAKITIKELYYGDCIVEEELGDTVTISMHGGSDENT